MIIAQAQVVGIDAEIEEVTAAVHHSKVCNYKMIKRTEVS